MEMGNSTSINMRKELLVLLGLFFSSSICQSQNLPVPIKQVPQIRTSGAQFGHSVDFFVIGAPFEPYDQAGGNILTDAGAAYVFEKDLAGSWIEVQKLVALDRSAGDQFGFSVSIDGDKLIVSAPEEDHDVSGNQFLDGAGSVYVFEKDINGTWVQTQKLVAWDRDAQDFFGYSVSISPERILIGAEREDHNASGGAYQPSAGSAYIFEQDLNEIWQPSQKLVALDRSTSDFFGSAVAICDSQIVIGAYREDEDENGLNSIGSAGSCYIFELGSTGSWSQTAKLVAPDRASSDFFGFSVAIDSNRVISGAYAEDHDSNFSNQASSAGSAYVFSKNMSGTWSFEQKLTASDREVGDEFGYSVSIQGDTIVVGAHQEDINQGTFSVSGAGSIYLYTFASASWNETAKIFAQDYGTQDYFGRSVAVSSTGIIVGAPFSDFISNDEAGAAFIADFESTPFPITLLSFSGTAISSGNQLDWETSGESTEGSFLVERKGPKEGQYVAIGLVDRQVSSGAAKSYRFLDASAPSGRALYRLKMVDLDGSVSYSNIVELFRDRGVGIRVYPNPTSDLVTFSTQFPEESLRAIELYDLTGRRAMVESIRENDVTEWQLSLENLSEGHYLYRVQTSEGVYQGLLEKH